MSSGPRGIEWWGGWLSDGTLVVISPSQPDLILGDKGTDTGLAPGGERAPGLGLGAWLKGRSGVPIPYGRSGHVIGARRWVLAMCLALLGLAVVGVNLLVRYGFGLSPTGWPGGAVVLGLATVVVAALAGLVYTIEVRPLLRAGVEFRAFETDDDRFLRYVDAAVASTQAWAILLDVARSYPPPSAKAPDAHAFLWDAAGFKGRIDTGTLSPEDAARLDETALFARGL